MEAGEGEVGSLQPWQIFTAMFLGFWMTSAYFDHLLMTAVFCIAFGVGAELITKFIYGEKMAAYDLSKQKEELQSLMEQSRIEKERETIRETLKDIDSPTKETYAANEAVWQKNDAEEEEEYGEDYEEENDDEEEPPPLPVKDYDYTVDGPEEMSLENIAETNTMIEDKTEEIIFESPSIVETIITAHNPANTSLKTAEEHMKDSIPMMEPVLEDTADIHNIDQTIEEGIDVSDHYNKDISMMGVEQCDSSNKLNETEKASEKEENEGKETSPLETKHPELINFKCNQASTEDDSEYDPAFEVSDNKFYAPDSSDEDDEELEEEYARREVNFDESESEDGDLIDSKNETVDDNVLIDKHNNNLLVDGDLQQANSSQKELADLNDGGKSEQRAEMSFEENSPISESIDIDLTDPAVEAAAAKIQFAFKGFKARKSSGK